MDAGINSTVMTSLTLCSGDNSTVSGESGSAAEFYERARWVTGLVLYPVICLVGLVGNTLTLVVLTDRKMRTSPTNVFLAALAVADVIKLLNDCLYVIVSVLQLTRPVHANTMLGLMYPLSHYIFNAAVCVASWLTVSVAVERYISVCHATRAKAVCSVGRSRLICVLVFFVMCVLSVPSYLRYTTLTCPHLPPTTAAPQPPAAGGPGVREYYYEVRLSALGRNVRFMAAYIWLQNLLRSIVPLLVLVLLNTCIIIALRKSRVKGKKLSARSRITLMLIVVIVVFIICILPDAIMSTFGYGYVEEGASVGRGVREITDTLLALNSAVNFAIYCMCSRVFRNKFVEIFCQRWLLPDPHYQSVISGRHTAAPGPVAHTLATEAGNDNHALVNVQSRATQATCTQAGTL